MYIRALTWIVLFVVDSNVFTDISYYTVICVSVAFYLQRKQQIADES